MEKTIQIKYTDECIQTLKQIAEATSQTIAGVIKGETAHLFNKPKPEVSAV